MCTVRDLIDRVPRTLLDILVGIGRTLVSAEERAVDDQKEHAWMALYANDRDVLEALLYRRLKTLWHPCDDLAIS